MCAWASAGAMTLSSGRHCHGQARDQGVELRRCERQQGRRVARARPDEAPRVEPRRRAPRSEAVVHSNLTRVPRAFANR